MTTTKKRAGRKQKSHQCSWDNSTIDGLYHCPDGRWRVTSTGQKFTEPDERRAVAKFLQMSGNRGGLVTVTAPVGDVLPSAIPAARPQTTEQTVDAIVSLMAATRGLPVNTIVTTNVAPIDWQIEMHTHEPTLWAWVREQILLRPKYVAQRLGIEQIAYLDDLKPPEKLPSLQSMIDIYKANAKCESEQVTKNVGAFEDFITTTKISSVKDITDKVVVAFQDHVHARIVQQRGGEIGPISGKQQQHIFGGIKTVLRLIRGRAVAVKAINEALSNLAILKPSKKVKKVKQQPIEVSDWLAIYGKATGENLAMVLLMLNGAYYLKEVINLNWSDIDERKQTITVNRRKTGECIRVCVLWPETIAALKALPRKGDAIFRNYTGNRTFSERMHEMLEQAIQSFYAKQNSSVFTAFADLYFRDFARAYHSMKKLYELGKLQAEMAKQSESAQSAPPQRGGHRSNSANCEVPRCRKRSAHSLLPAGRFQEACGRNIGWKESILASPAEPLMGEGVLELSARC